MSWRVMLVLLTLIVAREPAARAEVDFKAFKIAFVETVNAKTDAEIAKLDAQLADASLDPLVRANVVRARAELALFKKRVEDVSTAEALWDSLKNGKDAIDKIDLEFRASWNSAIHIGILNQQELSKLGKGSKLLGQGVDYAVKLKKLADDINGLSTTGLSPSSKQLAQSLTVMAALLSQFGDKAPLIGAFLKGYGDLAGEMIKTTTALDAKIAAREGGILIPGVHGDRGAMLDALGKLGIADAERVAALRDVFRGNDGRIVIWDRAVRGFVIASEVEPGISEDELVKRYLFYAKRGTTDPSVDQILKGYRRTIALELVASTDHVAPGGSVTLRVSGKMVADNQALAGRELFAKVTLTSHTGIGTGELQNPDRIKIGEAITWTAPNNLDETYTFTAELADETAKVAQSAGAATATVRTGTETRIELSASATEIPAGGPVELTAKLFTADGTALPTTVAGSIEITAEPALGYFADQTELPDQKGVKHTWFAPDQAGVYVFTAHYSGATSHRMFGDHTASSDATIKVTVGAPMQDAGVDGAEAAVDAQDVDAAVDAAVVADDGPPIDWPGTWRGQVKTTSVVSGDPPTTSTERIELQVTVENGNIVMFRKGFPKVVLTRTPSNPNAATGGGVIPMPAGQASLKSWDAKFKWTSFLAGGKLNIAVHLDIAMTVQASPTAAPVAATHTTDSIGVLSR